MIFFFFVEHSNLLVYIYIYKSYEYYELTAVFVHHVRDRVLTMISQQRRDRE